MKTELPFGQRIAAVWQSLIEHMRTLSASNSHNDTSGDGSIKGGVK